MFKSFLILRFLPLICLLLTKSVLGGQVHLFHREIDGSKLEYRISLSKDTFFAYEPTQVEVWVRNISDSSVKIHFFPEENWLLYDQNGKYYPPNSSVFYPPYELKQGDSSGGPACLENYGTKMPNEGYPYPGFPPGQYRVHYKIGKYSAPAVKFWVVEPKGEDAEALNLYLEAYAPTGNKGFISLPQSEKKILRGESARKFLSVWTTYPNSCYGKLALSSANGGVSTFLSDKEFARDMIGRLVQEFPNVSEWAVNLLWDYYRAQKDMDNLRSELNNLIEKNVAPKLTTSAKEALKRLKAEEQLR